LAFKNKEKWQNMGEASRKIVEDFSPDKIASQIYNSCKKVTSIN